MDESLFPGIVNQFKDELQELNANPDIRYSPITGGWRVKWLDGGTETFSDTQELREILRQGLETIRENKNLMEVANDEKRRG